MQQELTRPAALAAGGGVEVNARFLFCGGVSCILCLLFRKNISDPTTARRRVIGCRQCSTSAVYGGMGRRVRACARCWSFAASSGVRPS